jgi:hypothetical protein
VPQASITRLVACATVLAFMAAACGTVKESSRVPRSSIPGKNVTNPPIQTPEKQSPGASPLDLGDAPPDLRKYDWSKARLPGDFCGVSGLIKFKDGSANVQSQRWGPVHVFRSSEVIYGDVTGDGQTDAAVELICDNGGGTAAGQLGFAYLVMTSRSGQLASLGTILPQKNPAHVHTTLINSLELSKNVVMVKEAWYRPSDPDCCPSGRAVTVWTTSNGHLVAGSPNVTS